MARRSSSPRTRRATPGSEEYLNSEKYEIKHWDLENAWSLRDLIARVNQARRENPALQSDWRLTFHETDNEMLICYSKTTADFSNVILVVVNLDPDHTHSGWVTLDLDALGLDAEHPYQMHDLLGDSRHLWSGPANFIELDPQVSPAHVFRVRRKSGRNAISIISCRSGLRADSHRRKERHGNGFLNGFRPSSARGG